MFAQAPVHSPPGNYLTIWPSLILSVDSLAGHYMRRVVFALFVFGLSLSTVLSAQSTPPQQTIPVSQIHAGMRGVAYTVFQGIKPEPMEGEVLGVLRNVNGPKGDIILVRLHGTKVEYTGVVAGQTVPPRGCTSLATSTQEFANYLKPIETPLVFNGFSEDTVRRFAPQFAAAGIVPVMGAGSSSDAKQPEPLEPGSAISAILVRGDMDIAATCTVTYMDAKHLLACGHPLLQFGMVDLPMTKAQVVATLPSPLNAFKIVNATEPVGAFVQDRHTGIMGEFGKKPDMIPVTLNIYGGPKSRQFHYEVLNNARLSPVAMMATVFNALHGVNDYGEEITYRMSGRISVNGYPDVPRENMFAVADGGQPAAVLAALSLGDRFSRIYDNPYTVPDIQGVQLDFDLERDRRWARLEAARTDVTEARPGDEISIEAVLRPYRGESIVNHIPIHIPTSTSKGPLRILVSDGDTIDRIRHGAPLFGRKLELA